MIGIYKITSPDKKVYIGQSIDINKRFRVYRSGDNAKQPRLNESFVKYGILNHTFEVLTECSIDELNSKERYYQILYSATGYNGLNINLTRANNTRKIGKVFFKDEWFDSCKKLYEKYPDYFHSYGSLSYDLRKYNRVIIKKRVS